MNDKQKPSIRFKGFTEDWEQRKLSEIILQCTQELVGKILEHLSFEIVVISMLITGTDFEKWSNQL